MPEMAAGVQFVLRHAHKGTRCVWQMTLNGYA